MHKKLIYVLFLGFLYSQSFLDLTPRPSYNINKIDTPITLDGQLDEESWGLAQIATGFTDTRAFEGDPAAFKTEVKLLYDDTNLLHIRLQKRLELHSQKEIISMTTIIGLELT